MQSKFIYLYQKIIYTLCKQKNRFMALQKKYGIEELISLTKKDMGLVNDLIIQRTVSNTDMIPKVSQYLISSGGKRLRPMLTIASSKLCEGKNNYYIHLAAGV